MKGDAPGARSTLNQQRVLQTRPEALKLARAIARANRVRDGSMIKDCEQVACQALVESCWGYDASRGVPFKVYAWKRVAGAVNDWLRRERSPRSVGLDAAIEEAGTICDDLDPFAWDEDDAAQAQLNGYCRRLSFVRFLADRRELLTARPHDALVRAQSFQALSAALGGLSEQEKQLIELRYWQDLSWAKVAEVLGIHEKHAQRMDERLRERLRDDLQRRHVDGGVPTEMA